MVNILCYGDSNTYGYNPFNGRVYKKTQRWTGILQKMLGKQYKVIEEGFNGRTTVLDDPVDFRRNGKTYFKPILEKHCPVDLIIIMLGTNDLQTKFNRTPLDIANGVGELVKDAIEITKEKNEDGNASKVLLVSPIHIGENIAMSGFGPDFCGSNARERSFELAKYYKEVADFYGVEFMDASLFADPADVDSLHLDPEAHEKLAVAFKEKLDEIMK